MGVCSLGTENLILDKKQMKHRKTNATQKTNVTYITYATQKN